MREGVVPAFSSQEEYAYRAPILRMWRRVDRSLSAHRGIFRVIAEGSDAGLPANGIIESGPDTQHRALGLSDNFVRVRERRASIQRTMILESQHD